MTGPKLQAHYDIVFDGTGYLCVPPWPPFSEYQPMRSSSISTAPLIALFQTAGPLTIKQLQALLKPESPGRWSSAAYHALYAQVDALRRRGTVVIVAKTREGTCYGLACAKIDTR